LTVPQIEAVMVDTDSETIMEDVGRLFPTVKLIHRPEHLRADDIPMNDILLHDTAQLDAEFYLQTHSTNPLLKAGTISEGIEKFFAEYPRYDSLFSVTRLQTRLYFEDGRAINHDPAVLLQTQDLPPVYEENSCMYLFTRANLARKHHRIGDQPLMFEINRDEAWDIDEEIDFEITDFLAQKKSL
jgi:CMP-N-acetylneuraminic acid synthetase